MLTAIGAFVAPESLRMLRRWITEVRADLVSNIVQPGRFTAIEQGLAFYIRERRPNGLLVGLLMDDRRDPAQRVTIIAEHGEMVKNENGNFLLLENGSIQRHEAKQRDPEHRRVRSLRLRPVAVLRRHARSSNIPCASATSGS